MKADDDRFSISHSVAIGLALCGAQAHAPPSTQAAMPTSRRSHSHSAMCVSSTHLYQKFEANVNAELLADQLGKGVQRVKLLRLCDTLHSL